MRAFVCFVWLFGCLRFELVLVLVFFVIVGGDGSGWVDGARQDAVCFSNSSEHQPTEKRRQRSYPSILTHPSLGSYVTPIEPLIKNKLPNEVISVLVTVIVPMEYEDEGGYAPRRGCFSYQNSDGSLHERLDS
ncbi:hypothetical protein F5H01DRAFT_325081 [Linnemannia elongata]|nr:hypothetical protein F5H01DRAFT_325081 [Linnemannia elongata]